MHFNPYNIKAGDQISYIDHGTIYTGIVQPRSRCLDQSVIDRSSVDELRRVIRRNADAPIIDSSRSIMLLVSGEIRFVRINEIREHTPKVDIGKPAVKVEMVPVLTHPAILGGA